MKNSDEHSIEPYHFKVLGGANILPESESILPEAIKEVPPAPKEKVIKEEVIKQDANNLFVEKLLKKSDELSSNIIKLQMQIEKQEVEFQKRLTNDIKRESDNSFQKGYDKAKNDLQQTVNEIKEKFLNSINILEEQAKNSDEYLKKIEADLSSTAVEIAKEVILKELKQSSSEIAKALSQKLIEELKDAKNIKLKVNPKDFEALKENYSNIENIRVDSDLSIAEGGVVVLSDVGNLDGNLSTRIEKVKNLIQIG